MKKIIVIGGLGFIGFNMVLHLIDKKKYKVYIIDCLSGVSSKKNLNYMKKNNIKVPIFKLNIRDYEKTLKVIKKIKPFTIFLLSGQVAVTKSIKNPKKDFEDNLLSTFNILEIIRNLNNKINLVTVSSNKVYGDLKSLQIKETKTRYSSKQCINESFPLNFKTPYSCSKGAADQYVIDYSKVYGLKTVVLRLSCVYGFFQWGTEDQGWICWFIKRALQRKKINIFGNGKQVRDVLFITDLTELMEKCQNKISLCSGEAFNIGGGLLNNVSILELIKILENKIKVRINYTIKKKRKGDQNFFVNDLSKIKKITNWKPSNNLNDGLDKFIYWIKKNERI